MTFDELLLDEVRRGRGTGREPWERLLKRRGLRLVHWLRLNAMGPPHSELRRLERAGSVLCELEPRRAGGRGQRHVYSVKATTP